MGQFSARNWTLSFEDVGFIETLPTKICVESALQLCSVRLSGRFIEDWATVDDEILTYVASQVGLAADRPQRAFSNRTARRYRLTVAGYLGLSRSRPRHRVALETWLRETVCPSGGSVSEMLESSFQWFRDRRLLPPATGSLARQVRAARHGFLNDLLAHVARQLSPGTAAALDASLEDARGKCGFQRLKNDVGAATLDNILDAAGRLSFIRGLDLPFWAIAGIDPSWIKMLVRRVEAETPFEMKRRARVKCHGLLAIYLMSRRSQLIDGLVDMLIEIIHRIGTKSRRKVIGKIAADIEKVHGKERLLVDMATAAVDDPLGRVIDVIYPVAAVAKLKAVIEEHQAKGTLDRRIQTVMRGLYASHYRRMLPQLLSVLDFRSNNETWRPILNALSLISRLNAEGRRSVPAALAPDGSIPPKWRELVVDDRGRLNVISFSTYWIETTGFQPVRFSESVADLSSRILKPPKGYGFKIREERSCATRHPRTRDFTTGSTSCGLRNIATRCSKGRCARKSGRSSSRPATRWGGIS